MRGWIYRLSGQEGEAVRDLQSALDRDSRNPIALLQFGLLYSAKNEYTLAKTYLQTAIEADTSGTF
jgi:tetratricopeptide (TPR) repeat protein